MIKSIERQIAEAVVQRLIEAGYYISVDDGEEYVIKRSQNLPKIVDAMASTGEDYLRIYDAQTKTPGIGWIRFVYGNAGHEVINDYTTNLEDIMAPINQMIDAFEERQGI